MKSILFLNSVLCRKQINGKASPWIAQSDTEIGKKKKKKKTWICGITSSPHPCSLSSLCTDADAAASPSSSPPVPCTCLCLHPSRSFLPSFEGKHTPAVHTHAVAFASSPRSFSRSLSSERFCRWRASEQPEAGPHALHGCGWSWRVSGSIHSASLGRVFPPVLLSSPLFPGVNESAWVSNATPSLISTPDSPFLPSDGIWTKTCLV